MKDFIEAIKQRGILGGYTHFSGKWNNGAAGAIVLDHEGFIVFEKYTEDMKQSKAKEPIRLTNVRYGFVHWILNTIHQHREVDFETFYNACKDYFVCQSKNSPNSWKWKDNIDEYFANIHYPAMLKQLVEIPLYDYLDEKDSKLIRAYCSNYIEWLQYKLPNVKDKPLEESKQSQEEKRLPSILDTNEAKEMFAKAEEARLIKKLNDGKLQWNGTKTLLAYFADCATQYLELSNTTLGNGAMAAVFKPFEDMFGYSSLKTCKADWNKTKIGKPKNYEQVDNLFNKLYELDN